MLLNPPRLQEDRRWNFDCSVISTGDGSDGSWSAWTNEFNANFGFSCDEDKCELRKRLGGEGKRGGGHHLSLFSSMHVRTHKSSAHHFHFLSFCSNADVNGIKSEYDDEVRP